MDMNQCMLYIENPALTIMYNHKKQTIVSLLLVMRILYLFILSQFSIYFLKKKKKMAVFLNNFNKPCLQIGNFLRK